MQKTKYEDGKLGEEIAVSHLRKIGYQIIQRNFRIRGGEIDIIALDGDTLVFIEVKTRRSIEFGTALEAITPWKIRALIRAAYVYKSKHPRLPESLRIDAVAITLDREDNLVELELVQNIS